MNHSDTKTLRALLEQLKPIPHLKPQGVFEAIMALVVSVAIEIVLVRQDAVLLTWREDAFYRGWHFPGAILGVNESFDAAAARVVRNELGMTVHKSTFLRAINSSRESENPRSHVVSLLFAVQAEGEPRAGRWFTEMPEDIIPVHRKFWMVVEPLRVCSSQGVDTRRL